MVGSHASTAPLTDESALAHVASELGLMVKEEILDGGSSARVYKALRRTDGIDVAVKVLVEQPGVVDGHDLRSFAGKLIQLEAIRAHAPALADRYAPVLGSLAGDGWAAYTTQFYESQDAAACLRDERGDVELFLRQCDAIFAGLFASGYGAVAAPVPAGHLLRTNVGRFLRRFPTLEKWLPAELVGPGELIVNGVRCRSPRSLLSAIVHGDGLSVDHLGPLRLGLCAHGDANTRNLLVGTQCKGAVDFRIIDPRGSTEPWDPVYDLAKILFSLSVWDPALRLGFAVDSDHPGWRVGFGCATYEGYRTAIHAFLPYLEDSEALARVLDDDPHWRTRLVLTHDMHVLAEAPCRLSDPKPKWDWRGEPSTPTKLAIGHYLLGTLLINDFVDQLVHNGDIDADRHLGLLTGELPAA